MASSSWLPYSIGNVNWVGGGNPSRYVAKCLSAYFGQEGAIWTNFFCKISMFDIWRLNLCDRFLPGCSHLTAGRLFLQTMSKFILISGITRFRNYSFQALLVSGITRFRNSEFSDSVLVFVRGVIWHQGGYYCYIISQMNTYIINKILPRKCLALLTACRHLWQLHLVVIKFIQWNDTSRWR